MRDTFKLIQRQARIETRHDTLVRGGSINALRAARGSETMTKTHLRRSYDSNNERGLKRVLRAGMVRLSDQPLPRLILLPASPLRSTLPNHDD